MKTRYKILIIILSIIAISVLAIIMIDYVYANTDDFESMMQVFCPYFPVSDDFVADQIFFAVYHNDPIKQLDMIHYRFESVCHKQTVVSEHSMTFSAGNMTFHEELCIKNEGKWVNYQFDSKCYFETFTKLNLAETAFEEAGKTKITGDVAKNVCAILDIPCPEDPTFDAWLDRDEGTATFTFYKNKERFTFLIQDTEIRYMADSQNGWKIFDDYLLERFQDKPEVKAFYAKYPDALEEVREDHVSYVTGSDDGFKVRMNLYFDENYEQDYFTLRCYVDRELQNDVAETFIQKYLQKFECEKRPDPGEEPQKNLTLYVSNQSFENSPVDITVMIDGKVVVDGDFDVGNQHVYIDYNFMLTPGTHTIFAKSVTGEAELEKEFEIDEQKWAVLSYWFYPDDPHFESPYFEFEVFDNPVGFA